MKIKILFLIIVLMFISLSNFADSGFSEQDRERLVRVETTLKIFMEQVDKRHTELREDMNKRFEQIMTFLGILAAIFTALTLGIIAYAYWNRRTIIEKA